MQSLASGEVDVGAAMMKHWLKAWGGILCGTSVKFILGRCFQKAKFGVVQLSASIFWFCHADMVRSSVFFSALSSFGCRVAMLG